MSSWTPFYQHEQLTTRLHNVLQHEYASDVSIFREYIQNADDAGASDVVFVVDERQHPQDHLLTPQLAQWQGPALLVYNNAVFTDRDFTSISQLGQSLKAGDPSRIGKYGLGFNVSYHLTDIVSFVSRDQLVIFDPHGAALPGQVLGLRTNFLQPQWQESYAGHVAAFELPDLDVSFSASVSGTLFRLPFRTAETRPKSKLSAELPTAASVLTLLQAFATRGLESLLFLRNVVRVRILKRAASGGPAMLLYDCRLTPDQISARQQLANPASTLVDPRHGLHLTLRFTTTTANNFLCAWDSSPPASTTTEETWLVAVGAAEVSDKMKSLGYSPYAALAGLIATPAASACPCPPGRAFSFLPLPLTTGLPVHINGCFALSSNRRTLIWQDADNTTDASNQMKADWNKYLLQQVIPHCYIIFLQTLAGLAPQAVSNFLPLVRHTPTPFDLVAKGVFRQIASQNLALLFNADDGHMYSLATAQFQPAEEGGEVTTAEDDSSVSVSASATKRYLVKSLRSALAERHLNVVNLPPAVIQSFKAADVSVPLITHAAVTAAFRHSALPAALIPGLLKYVLHEPAASDAYESLQGLPVLPLLNDRWGLCHVRDFEDVGDTVSFNKRSAAGAKSRHKLKDSPQVREITRGKLLGGDVVVAPVYYALLSQDENIFQLCAACPFLLNPASPLAAYFTASEARNALAINHLQVENLVELMPFILPYSWHRKLCVTLPAPLCPTHVGLPADKEDGAKLFESTQRERKRAEKKSSLDRKQADAQAKSWAALREFFVKVEDFPAAADLYARLTLLWQVGRTSLGMLLKMGESWPILPTTAGYALSLDYAYDRHVLQYGLYEPAERDLLASLGCLVALPELELDVMSLGEYKGPEAVRAVLRTLPHHSLPLSPPSAAALRALLAEYVSEKGEAGGQVEEEDGFVPVLNRSYGSGSGGGNTAASWKTGRLRREEIQALRSLKMFEALSPQVLLSAEAAVPPYEEGVGGALSEDSIWDVTFGQLSPHKYLRFRGPQYALLKRLGARRPALADALALLFTSDALGRLTQQQSVDLLRAASLAFKGKENTTQYAAFMQHLASAPIIVEEEAAAATAAATAATGIAGGAVASAPPRRWRCWEVIDPAEPLLAAMISQGLAGMAAEFKLLPQAYFEDEIVLHTLRRAGMKTLAAYDMFVQTASWISMRNDVAGAVQLLQVFVGLEEAAVRGWGKNTQRLAEVAWLPCTRVESGIGGWAVGGPRLRQLRESGGGGGGGGGARAGASSGSRSKAKGKGRGGRDGAGGNRSARYMTLEEQIRADVEAERREEEAAAAAYDNGGEVDDGKVAQTRQPTIVAKQAYEHLRKVLHETGLASVLRAQQSAISLQRSTSVDVVFSADAWSCWTSGAWLLPVECDTLSEAKLRALQLSLTRPYDRILEHLRVFRGGLGWQAAKLNLSTSVRQAVVKVALADLLVGLLEEQAVGKTAINGVLRSEPFVVADDGAVIPATEICVELEADVAANMRCTPKIFADVEDVLVCAGALKTQHSYAPVARLKAEIDGKDADLLLSKIQRQWLRKTLADVVFMVRDEQRVYAHKLVLALSSEVFYAMFSGDMVESSNLGAMAKIDVRHVSKAAVELLLSYMYLRQMRSETLGDLQPPTSEKCEVVCDLLALADQYLLEEVKAWCEVYLTHPDVLSTTNLVAFLSHAVESHAPQLRKVCIFHLRGALAAVTHLAEWQELAQEIKDEVLSFKPLV